MNIVADEGVDKFIIDQLRKNGYNVVYVAELSPGLNDSEVLNITKEEKAVLLTADKDFGEIIFRHGETSNGIVLIRLQGLSAIVKAKIVLEFFNQHSQEILGSFTVISPTNIRIRSTIN